MIKVVRDTEVIVKRHKTTVPPIFHDGSCIWLEQKEYETEAYHLVHKGYKLVEVTENEIHRIF